MKIAPMSRAPFRPDNPVLLACRRDPQMRAMMAELVKMDDAAFAETVHRLRDPAAASEQGVAETLRAVMLRRAETKNRPMSELVDELEEARSIFGMLMPLADFAQGRVAGRKT